MGTLILLPLLSLERVSALSDWMERCETSHNSRDKVDALTPLFSRIQDTKKGGKGETTPVECPYGSHLFLFFPPIYRVFFTKTGRAYDLPWVQKGPGNFPFLEDGIEA